MAARKTSKKASKQVTVEITREELLALLEAAEALVRIAEAKIIASDDPVLQKRAKKRRGR